MTAEANVSKGNFIQFNPANLYERRSIIDEQAGVIDIYTPVLVSGTIDPMRRVRYASSVTMAVNGVPQVVNFELPVDSLAAALDAYEACATEAVQKRLEQIEDQNRRRQIITGGSPPVRPIHKTH